MSLAVISYNYENKTFYIMFDAGSGIGCDGRKCEDCRNYP